MVVKSQSEYEALKERMNRDAYISTPIFRDIQLHPSINPILCVGITFLNGDFHIISVSHDDAPCFDMVPESINLEVCVFLQNGTTFDIEDLYSSYILNTHSVFKNIKDCNRIIPITQWSSLIRKYHINMMALIDFSVVDTDSYRFMNMAVATLRRIEASGITVNTNLLNQFFPNRTNRSVLNNLAYSQYFPYTTTGRPSNRFGGINFAALNKSDGSREAFVSRFENGKLLQIDFESYHLRLIAHYMGMHLPDEPIHLYLAKQYFEKDTISQEEYEEGKQITFSILYGTDVDTDIPLLKNIRSLSKKIFTKYQTEGLTAPYSGRTIMVSEMDATENKLFNYFVQSLEFESTVPKLSKLLNFLDSKASKLVLYTYDAVLLDCHPDELEEICSITESILCENKFPVRTYTGETYHSLKG